MAGSIPIATRVMVLLLLLSTSVVAASCLSHGGHHVHHHGHHASHGLHHKQHHAKPAHHINVDSAWPLRQLWSSGSPSSSIDGGGGGILNEASQARESSSLSTSSSLGQTIGQAKTRGSSADVASDNMMVHGFGSTSTSTMDKSTTPIAAKKVARGASWWSSIADDSDVSMAFPGPAIAPDPTKMMVNSDNDLDAYHHNQNVGNRINFGDKSSGIQQQPFQDRNEQTKVPQQHRHDP